MTAPIKTCDYCGATGEMPTFMDGETICYTCLPVLPKTLPEARQELMRLRAELAVAQPAPNVVAYLDIGAGGYMDIGTDLTDEELDAIPKGRHMLGIAGTYGIDGYVPAQPAPSVPDGWLRAIDEALVTAHLGVANTDDSYEQARKKLANLIGWHVDVATDPAVNGGWKLVPTEPTKEMRAAWDSSPICEDDDAEFRRAYSEMLAAAQEAKP